MIYSKNVKNIDYVNYQVVYIEYSNEAKIKNYCEKLKNMKIKKIYKILIMLISSSCIDYANQAKLKQM